MGLSAANKKADIDQKRMRVYKGAGGMGIKFSSKNCNLPLPPKLFWYGVIFGILAVKDKIPKFARESNLAV